MKTPIGRRRSSNAAPHRILKAGMSGSDVRKLQVATGARLHARGLGRYAPADDGQFGPQTARAAARAAWELGALLTTAKAVDGGKCPTGVQNLIRYPGRRDPHQLARARDRVRHRYPLDITAGEPPAIVTSAELGLRFQWVFGAKGALTHGAGHYTAGRRVPNRAALIEEMRSDHRFHAGQGWGGVVVRGDGRGRRHDRVRQPARPEERRGRAPQHRARERVLPGDDRRQDRGRAGRVREVAARALAHRARPRRVPAAAARAGDLTWLGHREFPDQATACPGDMLAQYHDLFRSVR
jgi:hypothetical protein